MNGMNGWRPSAGGMGAPHGGGGPGTGRTPLPRRGLRGPVWIDAVSAVLYFALSPQFASPAAGGLRTDLLLSGVISGVLLVRSRYPRAVIVTVLALTLAKVSLGASDEPMIATGWAMAAYVATRPPRGGKTLVALLTAASMLLALFIGGSQAEDPDDGPRVLLSLLSIVAGVAIGANSAAVRESSARAAQARADERTRGERLRIARDLHDVTSRTLVSIGVQAGVAAAAGPRSENLRKTLLAIEEQSKDAADEIRTMLVSLRSTCPDATPPAPLRKRVDDVIASAGRAGVTCTTELDLPAAASPQVEDTLCRALEEALTNVAKHTASRCADVRISRRADGGLVELVVEDAGSGAPGPWTGRGLGLAGMSERVSELGGALRLGPSRTGGTRLCVELPLTAERSRH
ncbi:histidine kinase [uncultured Propionibacterium sp.]|uniref:sensor histidine kinase n=1 Tax=uncultured Propionibacterium sp. TaxID=218066 RepID=UPI00292E6872|nr:histidine kinase [uncultured Propionibacterium sp.]